MYLPLTGLVFDHLFLPVGMTGEEHRRYKTQDRGMIQFVAFPETRITQSSRSAGNPRLGDVGTIGGSAANRRGSSVPTAGPGCTNDGRLEEQSNTSPTSIWLGLDDSKGERHSFILI